VYAETYMCSNHIGSYNIIQLACKTYPLKSVLGRICVYTERRCQDKGLHRGLIAHHRYWQAKIWHFEFPILSGLMPLTVHRTQHPTYTSMKYQRREKLRK